MKMCEKFWAIHYDVIPVCESGWVQQGAGGRGSPRFCIKGDSTSLLNLPYESLTLKTGKTASFNDLS